jgi:hypothetical protein
VPSPRRSVLSLLFILVLVTVAGLSSAPPERDALRPPNETEIAQAVARVKADPNLKSTGKLTYPHWRSSGKRTDWSWVAWLAAAFAYLAQSSRPLFWAAVFALAIGLLAYFIRAMAARTSRADAERLIMPTHVRDLDIRPESLPADIGAAARALWDAGQRRAALALLYRGLLSRLAHVYRLPIRDSTTEGDCLVLTRGHLDEARFEYSARLVRVWQRAVYGGTDADGSTVYELCDSFAGALDHDAPSHAQVAP